MYALRITIPFCLVLMLAACATTPPHTVVVQENIPDSMLVCEDAPVMPPREQLKQWDVLFAYTADLLEAYISCRSNLHAIGTFQKTDLKR